MATIAVIGGLIILILLFLVYTYSVMNQKRGRCREARSRAASALQRRHDIIPSFVVTVKEYAGQENAMLQDVVKARNAAMGIEGIARRAAAENALTAAIDRLFAAGASFPRLKASENFAQLQEELRAVETNITAARREYNDAVSEYNETIQKYPCKIVAGMFGFTGDESLELDQPGHPGAAGL